MLNKWPRPFYSFEPGDKHNASSSANEHCSDDRSTVLSPFFALEMVSHILVPVCISPESPSSMGSKATIISHLRPCYPGPISSATSAGVSPMIFGCRIRRWLFIYSFFFQLLSVYPIRDSRIEPVSALANLSSAYVAEYFDGVEGLGIVRAPYILSEFDCQLCQTEYDLPCPDCAVTTINN